MTYHKLFKLSNPGKSRLAFNSRDSQSVFQVPSAMAETWELTREGTWEVTQASSSIPLHSLKERKMFVGDLQFAEKGTSLVPPIHKFRKLRNSSPTHNNNNNSTAEGYSELLHCPEMGLLMDNCRLAYTRTGRLVGCIACILSVHCQMIYRKR